MKVQRKNRTKKLKICGRIGAAVKADKMKWITLALSVLPVIASFWTIVEMRGDRAAAYRPSIAIEPVEIFTAWSEDFGFTANPLSAEFDARARAACDAYKIALTHEDYEFKIINAGAQNAKNVRAVWDEGNIRRLQKQLSRLDPQKAEWFDEDGGIWQKYCGKIAEADGKTELRWAVISCETAEGCGLKLPALYACLLNEIVKEPQYAGDAALLIRLEYEDIHGKGYDQTFEIKAERIELKIEDDDSGGAVYRLIPCERP